MMTGTEHKPDQERKMAPAMPAEWLVDGRTRSARPSGRRGIADRKPGTFERAVRRRRGRARDARLVEVNRRGAGALADEIGSAGRVPGAGANETSPRTGTARPSPPALPAPAPPCRLAQCAFVALRGRAAVDGRSYRLDGARATLAELVAAAREAGAALPYPGIHPHAAAFHTGPSAALPRTRHGAANAGDKRNRREHRHDKDQDLAGAAPGE